MITVYVEADNIDSEVTNISLKQLRNNYIKATMSNTNIDLSKLNHYFLKEVTTDKSKNNTKNVAKEYELVYDENRYKEMIQKKEKQVGIEEGTKRLEELQFNLTLKQASDKDAYVMRYIYIQNTR